MEIVYLFSSSTDCKDLFPDSKLSSGEPLTVMTFCQRTKADMSSWSQEVENEREELLGYVSKKEEGALFLAAIVFKNVSLVCLKCKYIMFEIMIAFCGNKGSC